MTQRPIKFRAWDTKENKWVNGFEDITIPIGRMDEYAQKRGWVLLQFTGLTDKNGVEIYEGDLLIDDVDDLLEVRFGKLPLDKSGDCVCTYLAFYCKNYGQLGRAPSHECQNIGDWMEVIGNIYSNPELLAPNH